MSELKDILITGELDGRPARTPDHAAESRALVMLARVLADDAAVVLQRLVEVAMELTGAHTAGLSLLEQHDGETIFRWRAIAGQFSNHLMGMAPRDFSPCGVTVDSGEPQLLSYPGRHFSYLGNTEPPIVESLLIPFLLDAKPAGTLWLISHDESRNFDNEDVRIMRSLGEFAASALQLTQAVSELRTRDERYRVLVQNIKDYAIFMTSPDMHILEWNTGAERVKGYKAEEIIGQHISLFYTPEDLAKGEPYGEFGEAARLGRAEREGWRVRKGGERFWVNEIVTSLKDGNGNVLAFTKIARDLSERKHAQDALQASEERYRLAVENVTDYAIVTYTVENLVTSWNYGAAQIFGYAAEEMIGQNGAILFTAEDRAAGEVEKELANATVADRTPDERWHLRKDGTRFWASGVMHAMTDSTGNLRGYVKVCRDETLRRHAEVETRKAKAELEVRVAERTEELHHTNEELRGEIAERRRLLDELVKAQEQERERISRELHDHLGQHLTALLLGLSAAEEQVVSDHKLREKLQMLKGQTNTLTDDLRKLAVELRPPLLDEFGLKPAILDHIDEWSDRTKIPVDLQWSLAEEEKLSATTETTIYRILQEALTNVARHARARNVGVIVSRNDGFVHMIIEDDGVGFDVESVVSIRGKLHLGLNSMRERAVLVGGRLTIESEPGSGTSILCRLPVTAADISTGTQKST